MIRAYVETVKKTFRSNLVYRLDYIAGVVNTVLLIFVNIAIWKAIYEEEEVLGGIEFNSLMTYLVISFLMQSLFTMDEWLIERKVTSGSITTDLLKPFSFNLFIFSQNLGTFLFRFCMQVLPALLVALLLFRILPPFSPLMACYFVISIILGYLILYNFNYIIWISAFWFNYTFTLLTIKDALLMVLSGALLPLWFMPSWLMDIIEFTPFDSIFFIPISIYLGQVPGKAIIFLFIKQLCWLAVLFAIGQLLWKRGTRRLVLQGG